MIKIKMNKNANLTFFILDIQILVQVRIEKYSQNLNYY